MQIESTSPLPEKLQPITKAPESEAGDSLMQGLRKSASRDAGGSPQSGKLV